MRRQSQRLESACVFCGSADEADPEFLRAAGALGKALADAGMRLVYGGGGVGLMGAVARGAHGAGGDVLGIIPTFLVGKERALEMVEHIIVDNMHERKMLMFQRSDSFVILPGGIGTLEEVVELLSWRRLDLARQARRLLQPSRLLGAAVQAVPAHRRREADPAGFHVRLGFGGDRRPGGPSPAGPGARALPVRCRGRSPGLSHNCEAKATPRESCVSLTHPRSSPARSAGVGCAMRVPPQENG